MNEQVTEKLSLPIPDHLLRSKIINKGGDKVPYLPWYSIIEILNQKFGDNWEWQIKNIEVTAERIFVIGSLSIQGKTREAIGTELLKETIFDKKKKELVEREIVYGDPSSNAEAMALKRCASKFGLGLNLWKKTGSSNNTTPSENIDRWTKRGGEDARRGMPPQSKAIPYMRAYNNNKNKNGITV